jgi:hypothetical protein
MAEKLAALKQKGGDSLPDSLQISVTRASSQTGSAGYCRIPAELVNKYKYFTISGNSNGYYYYDSTYAMLSLNTRYLVEDYPCSEWCAIASNAGSANMATITFSN